MKKGFVMSAAMTSVWDVLIESVSFVNICQVLEMSADYQPVISDYKEAKVVSCDHSSGRVTLELLDLFQPDKKAPGRFDVSIEDDNEIFTNVSTSQDKQIALVWNTVFEPRLITSISSG